MVSIPRPEQTSAPDVQDGSDDSKVNTKPFEIVFLQDTTGSQGPYITAARKAIRDICDKISSTGELSKELIRFGLIAFRDHPPQDGTYVTKNFGFTFDVNVMYKNLSSLIASGGGDGPEAQTAALADALNMQWSEKAIKLVILITDSPPHGLGESGDGFSESPDQNDPLEIVRQMAERGITLFVVACEPSLSQQYTNALDFYTALTQITSGRVFPLLMADKLGDYIVGTAIETIDTEKLIGEFEKVIVEDIYTNKMPVEKVAQNLQQFMNQNQRKINTINVEDIYIPSDIAEANRKMWFGAAKISGARSSVQTISTPRIQEQYLSTGGTTGHMWVTTDMPGSSGALSSGRGRGGVMSRARREAFGAPVPSAPAVSPTFFTASMAATGAPVQFQPLAQQVQQVSLGAQQVSQAQAQRIVMQSISRNSKVTATGMISKKTGQAAVIEPTPPA